MHVSQPEPATAPDASAGAPEAVPPTTETAFPPPVNTGTPEDPTSTGSAPPAEATPTPPRSAPADALGPFPPSPTTAPDPTRTRSLYVPVRRGPAGTVLQLWRTPFGTRTAVAFTSDRRLRSVLGPCQPWIRLSESALRRMAEPLGTRHVTVDPVLTARPPSSRPSSSAPCPPTD